VIPIGLTSAGSIEDGHKFGCGIPFISGSPIVYSFGSHKQQDFETAILQLRPDASVFTFELAPEMIPAISDRVHGVQFFNIGLGYEKKNEKTGVEFKSFAEIMTMLNHTYVDVVKMDVEGYEWHWIHKEPETIHRVGQLLIELHIEGLNEREYPGESAVSFVERLEAKDLRMFHKEVNHEYPHLCTELSFIQVNVTVFYHAII